MYNNIIIRYGELGLKGRNFSQFQQALLDDIERRLSPYLKFNLQTTYGRIFIQPQENLESLSENMIRALKFTPGIVSFSPAVQLPADADLNLMTEKGIELIRKNSPEQDSTLTFKVKTNRANKEYPINSMEINKKIGARVLKHFDDKTDYNLSVDVHDPELMLEYDVRENGIFVFTKRYPGSGGLPAGSSEKALLLLSGGIDSPVAGWKVMRRGVEISNLHFHTPPYTGEKALQKVRDHTRKLARYNGDTELYTVNITDIQKKIWSDCPRSYAITLLRRMMMRIASRLGKNINASGLVTGDSIGQVASQTLVSIRTISAAASLPLLRPLLTDDKQDIISLARELNTYSISTRPHEDCCTLFIPDNPITRPRLEKTEALEEELPVKDMIEKALNNVEKQTISPDKYSSQ